MFTCLTSKSDSYRSREATVQILKDGKIDENRWLWYKISSQCHFILLLIGVKFCHNYCMNSCPQICFVEEFHRHGVATWKIQLCLSTKLACQFCSRAICVHALSDFAFSFALTSSTVGKPYYLSKTLLRPMHFKSEPASWYGRWWGRGDAMSELIAAPQLESFCRPICLCQNSFTFSSSSPPATSKLLFI